MKKNKTCRKLKIAYITLIALLLCVVITVIGVNSYIVNSTRDSIVTGQDLQDFDADCILVLGAGVNGNMPSPMLKDRLDTAINLYNDGKCNKIIMSGDHGQTEYDEVNVMKSYAIQKGVPSEDIFMDHAGFSTYESLYRASYIFEAKKIIIVTQRYHIYRALYLAKSLDMEAVGVETPQRIYGGEKYREAREISARCKDFLYTLVKPEPTFLGDTIPVSGDGDLTND